ncbi:MAG: hypothetical protein ACO1O6_12885 [Bacteroidota bacterium]
MKKYAYILLIVLTVLFFKHIREGLLSLHFSWTVSFSFPYFLLLLLGVLLALAMRPVLKRFPKALRILFLLLLVVLPFGAGFALHPIYEGDYASGGTAITQNNSLANGRDADFIVLTIPHCPFCKESTTKINRLQKRNPAMRIKYVVCSSRPEATQELRSLLDKRIRIELAQDQSQALDISGGKFPTFLQIEKGLARQKWNNMQLGVLALDKIESSLPE